MERSTRSSSTCGASGRPPAAAQVVVMAKYPSPGSVKTRLAAQLGAAAACRLYTAFVGDLAERLAIAGLPVCWAIWPPGAPFETLVPGQRCIAQVGRDLGERLEAAMRACLGEAALPVIAVGADAPHLEPDRLSEAAEALAGQADLVLGPAADGGYYLIGLRAPCPELFRGIAWGSSTVLDATLARARAAGLRVHLLAPTFDVDDVDGLAALQALLARGAVALPRTAAVLAEL
jgi:rSAM/selenodomain-associated transferase 1